MNYASLSFNRTLTDISALLLGVILNRKITNNKLQKRNLIPIWELKQEETALSGAATARKVAKIFHCSEHVCEWLQKSWQIRDFEVTNKFWQKGAFTNTESISNEDWTCLFICVSVPTYMCTQYLRKHF